MGGGTLIGNGYSTAIDILDSENIEITGLTIKGFTNKGINITGSSNFVKIQNNTVSNATSETGVGISIWSTSGVKNCTISNNTVLDSRVGISINGGTNVLVSDNQIHNSELSGIMLDGVVSFSGDGPKHCIVSNNIIDGTTASEYAGIYFGNGASNNSIIGNIIRNCTHSGIRYATDAENVSSVNNTISLNQIYNSGKHGITMAQMKVSIISGNRIVDSGEHGIYLYASDNNSIQSNYISGSEKGIYLQSGDNWVNSNVVSSNNCGLHIEWGGSNVMNNVVENNDFSGNTNPPIINGTNRVLNNRGYNY
jgi:parallel beta-helix repeat protein